MDHHGGTTSSPVERRHLGERPFVSLVEALTWVAFGDAMLPDDLRAQVEGHRPPVTGSPEERLRKFFAGDDADVPEVPGLSHFEDRQSGLGRLTVAWRQLRDEVERGSIKMRGRFSPTYSIADARLADVEELNGNFLATFSQFDVSTGGIRRQPNGSPDILWQDDTHSFNREFEAFGEDPRAAGGYLLVEVESDALLRHFPNPMSSPADPHIAAISTAGAENECRDWLASEFAADLERRRSKGEFRRAALVRFNGRLSVRGFDHRVWPTLAQQHGRSGPGAKRKS